MSDPIAFSDAAMWLAAIAVPVFGWFLNRTINRVDSDISSKADHEQMTREIARLEMRLKETQEARERDRSDIERASTEWRNNFMESMRDRLSSMERNMDAKLDMILEFVRQGGK